MTPLLPSDATSQSVTILRSFDIGYYASAEPRRVLLCVTHPDRNLTRVDITTPGDRDYWERSPGATHLEKDLEVIQCNHDSGDVLYRRVKRNVPSLLLDERRGTFWELDPTASLEHSVVDRVPYAPLTTALLLRTVSLLADAHSYSPNPLMTRDLEHERLYQPKHTG